MIPPGKPGRIDSRQAAIEFDFSCVFPQTFMDTSARILVVEDEPEIAAVLARYFGGQGYAVTTAGNGAAARRAMAADAIDLVLLDLGLPGEDGLALMRSLRESSDVAVIVVTGRGDAV